MVYEREKKSDYSVIGGIEVDGFGGEAEGSRGALVGLVNGTKVVHGFNEVWLVSDGDHWVRTIVLWKRSHVGPLRSLTQEAFGSLDLRLYRNVTFL
jgi:hypothetical protein